MCVSIHSSFISLIYTSNWPSIYPHFHSSTCYPSPTHLTTHPNPHWSIHLFICLSACPSICMIIAKGFQDLSVNYWYVVNHPKAWYRTTTFLFAHSSVSWPGRAWQGWFISAPRAGAAHLGLVELLRFPSHVFHPPGPLCPPILSRRTVVLLYMATQGSKNAKVEATRLLTV